MWGTGGLEETEGLQELPLFSGYCDGGKKAKDQMLQVLSEHPLPASLSQKSNGAALVSPRRCRLEIGAWWDLLCSAFDHHWLHPHPAAGVRAFELVLGSQRTDEELPWVPDGINTSEKPGSLQHLNPELGAGHYGPTHINPDLTVQAETSPLDWESFGLRICISSLSL